MKVGTEAEKLVKSRENIPASMYYIKQIITTHVFI